MEVPKVRVVCILKNINKFNFYLYVMGVINKIKLDLVLKTHKVLLVAHWHYKYLIIKYNNFNKFKEFYIINILLLFI